MVKPQLPMIAVVTPSAGDASEVRVPRDLRVVVRVVVDDARREREALRIHDCSRRADVRADRRDAAAADRQVARTRRRTEAVDRAARCG